MFQETKQLKPGKKIVFQKKALKGIANTNNNILQNAVYGNKSEGFEEG